ncbi:MAG: DNA mismatch repair endonuclease MutL [bacterium]
MSNIIKLLPDSVANQIAAGEVIQRPASAVKELMENSLDAGATQIELVIRDAGKSLIQVIDNGCGMSPIDARMSFERHATSKISDANDLFAIRTLGFRGEALASIAAIAHVEVKTRQHEDELGTCLKIEGSEVKSQEPCPCASGTNILVKNLFFNVPARRNFLKSNTAETRHIIEEFTRVALFQPEISFGMIHNDKPVFKLPAGSLKSRILGLFGNHYNERLLPVDQSTQSLRISGFIGKPEFARKTRGEQYFFVNNRFIKHAYLNHAVANTYTELIPTDAYPSYFLNIEMDTKEIDINIHPTKTEVNFRDARLVYGVLQAAVKKSIGLHSLSPTIDFDLDPSIEQVFVTSPGDDLKKPTVKIDPDYNPFNKGKTGDTTFPRRQPADTGWQKLYGDTPSGDRDTGEGPDELSTGGKPMAASRGRFFQVQNRYILTNIKSGLMFIDQQRAHERILYEQYFKQLSGKGQASQQQLFPYNLQFSAGEAEVLRTLLNDLSRLGFHIETFGGSSFVVNGIPADMHENDITLALEKIVENHKQHARDINYDKSVNLARSLAVSNSMKEGKKLSETEMEDIFDRLFSCQVPEVSPDGKRIIKVLVQEELEKLMKK